MGLILEQGTKEQKQTKSRLELNTLMLNGAEDLYAKSQSIWKLFWANPDGLSCQDMFDSFGADALAMAQLLDSAKTLITKVNPTLWTLERPGTVTPVIGGDGKPTGYVTVTLSQ